MPELGVHNVARLRAPLRSNLLQTLHQRGQEYSHDQRQGCEQQGNECGLVLRQDAAAFAHCVFDLDAEGGAAEWRATG